MIGDWEKHIGPDVNEETAKMMVEAARMIQSGEVPAYAVSEPAEHPCQRCHGELDGTHSSMILKLYRGPSYEKVFPDDWIPKEVKMCKSCTKLFLGHFLGMEGMVCT